MHRHHPGVEIHRCQIHLKPHAVIQRRHIRNRTQTREVAEFHSMRRVFRLRVVQRIVISSRERINMRSGNRTRVHLNPSEVRGILSLRGRVCRNHCRATSSPAQILRFVSINLNSPAKSCPSHSSPTRILRNIRNKRIAECRTSSRGRKLHNRIGGQCYGAGPRRSKSCHIRSRHMVRRSIDCNCCLRNPSTRADQCDNPNVSQSRCTISDSRTFCAEHVLAHFPAPKYSAPRHGLSPPPA